MGWLRTGWLATGVREVWGLFVDDGSLAVAILVWVGGTWLAELWLGKSGGVVGVLLFGGLAVILVESVVRFARGRRAG